MLTAFKHQTKTLDRFRTIPQGLDLSDAGTGKTRVQIDLFAERYAVSGKCALILGPKSLLETAWDDDITKFAPHLETSIAYASNRETAFRTKAAVYITNHDAVRWLAKQRPKFFARFDTLIIDEISAFKHRTSLRSRCLKKITKYFKYRYGLTGTPNTNSILDVWHQVFVIDDGERLGRTFMHFRQSVASPIQVGPAANMVKWVDKPGAQTAVADLISDISVRYTLEECHDLPKNNMYEINYHLTPHQRIAYEHMAKHAILETQNNETINAVNAAVLITKLLQIASGTVYDESNTSVTIESDRYQLVTDLVAARPHSLVFFHWKHQAKCLEELFHQAGITSCRIDGTITGRARTKVIREFQQGYYQVCLAQPQSAAHGLTLTRATTAIWPSPTYNLEHFIQGNHRIHRAGQERKTETILITAKNTIEQMVYAKLRAKDVKQIDFLAMLKGLSE